MSPMYDLHTPALHVDLNVMESRGDSGARQAPIPGKLYRLAKMPNPRRHTRKSNASGR